MTMLQNISAGGLRRGNEGLRSVAQPAVCVGRTRSIRIPEMIRVPQGEFQMGCLRWLHTQPLRNITMTAFSIGKYPVTNEEYRSFLTTLGRRISPLVADAKYSKHPVVDVSWFDAMEYCRFLEEITGRKFSLPTEAQWEFAAKGAQGRIYPWGNESYKGRVNFDSRGTTPVDLYMNGATPTDIFDMSGNVWEWCFDGNGGYAPKDLKDPVQHSMEPFRALRGSSWRQFRDSTLITMSRNCNRPEAKYNDMGFRVVENDK